MLGVFSSLSTTAPVLLGFFFAYEVTFRGGNLAGSVFSARSPGPRSLAWTAAGQAAAGAQGWGHKKLPGGKMAPLLLMNARRESLQVSVRAMFASQGTRRLSSRRPRSAPGAMSPASGKGALPARAAGDPPDL